MKIILDGVSKKFQRNWIFRNITYTIEEGDCIAITGHNGSGKSTLLKIISTFIDPTTGRVTFIDNEENRIREEDVAMRISYAAPYVNLIEELTLKEKLEFHSAFKKNLLDLKDIARKAGLAASWNKPINVFSSGMKQRLKLALGFYFSSDILFLDEPTSNMDDEGVSWFKSELKGQIGRKIILIASNQRYEYELAQREIKLTEYKYL